MLPASPTADDAEARAPAARKASKPGYHHGDLRAALIMAGLDLLETGGLEALSLRTIAKRVGVSHTAPKNHFTSMLALRTALASEGFWRLAIALKDAATGSGPRQEKLRSAVNAYVQFALGQPALFQLMFLPGLSDPEDPILAEAERAAAATLSRLSPATGGRGLSGALPQHQKDADHRLWSFMHGYAMLAISGRLARDKTGRPIHDVFDVMPAFDGGD